MDLASEKKTTKKSSSLVILCQLFYPELISTGQILTELAEELVRLGLDVEAICGPPSILDRRTRVPRYILHKGIIIKRVFGTRFSKLSFFGKLSNQISYALSTLIHLVMNPSKKPILVLTDPPYLGFICAILKIMCNRTYIFLVFDVYPDTAIKLKVLKENGLIAKLWDRCNRFILKHASSVIVIGRCMKNVILDKGKDIQSLPSKTHMIHVWSDDRFIQPLEDEKNPFIRRWNLEKKFTLSYSGNMGRFHDMETIMEAARGLNKNNDICFLFIGEGYKKKWMEEYAKKWGLDNCQFHTYVKREELRLSLACADVGLVSLSPGQEGLSVPSKTYGILAVGIPVVGIMNRNSEIAHVIEENKCGFVIEPGNVEGLVETILMLYSNPDLCKSMGQKGSNAVKEKYNLNNAASKYYSIIKSI